MSTCSMAEQAARHVMGLSPDYHIGQIACREDGYSVHLYKCPLKTKGKCKGQPNFRKATANIHGLVSKAMVEEAKQRYIAETGNCPKCDGSGKELYHWCKEMTEFRHCPDCEGTGRFDKVGDKADISPLIRVTA